MKRSIAIAAAALFALGPAMAINKCMIDGKVVFQDADCPGKGEAIHVRPARGHAPADAPASSDSTSNAAAEVAAINRRAEIRAAIERGEPLIGMTESELSQAIGRPNRANLANYNGTPHNQLIYERGGRTLYVYTDAGIVKAIQNTESVGASRRAAVRCPTPQEIRSMETSASSITLSEAERVERLRQINEAKRCGRY